MNVLFSVLIFLYIVLSIRAQNIKVNSLYVKSYLANLILIAEFQSTLSLYGTVIKM